MKGRIACGQISKTEKASFSGQTKH